MIKNLNSFSNVMTWRSINAKGSIKFIPDSDLDKLQTQYIPIYDVCEKHKVVSCGRKAYVLHVQEEHSY